MHWKIHIVIYYRWKNEVEPTQNFSIDGNSSSRGSGTLFCGHHTHPVHKHTCRKARIHMKIKKYFRKFTNLSWRDDSAAKSLDCSSKVDDLGSIPSTHTKAHNDL